MNPNNFPINTCKPYQLVWVHEEGYKYIGEVMSMPTLEGTAMVRRVPDHPGTLVEQPLSKLEALAKSVSHRKVAYARVDAPVTRNGKSVGQFPVDMLRYDACAPVNFTIVDEGRGHKAVIDESFGLDYLLVAKLKTHADPQWTQARWNSFMWSLIPVTPAFDGNSLTGAV